LAGAPSPRPGAALADTSAPGAWHRAFAEYRRRKEVARADMPTAAAPTGDLASAAIGTAASWLSLGPLVVMDGQTGGGERQPVAGRVAGLAVGPGGNTV
jgi:hypothetical protein